MNAIVPRSHAPATRAPVLTPQTFDQLMTFAEMAAGSDLVPKDYRSKPSNIVIAVQMGAELGLQPMQALNSIAVINGRPGVWGDGLLGLCRQSPLCEDIREWYEGEGDARKAICEAKRHGASPVTGEFSIADAKVAGLWKKAGPWTQYPDRMLKNRARGFALRDAFPDLLRGLKTVEELQDYQREERAVQSVELRPEPRPQAAPARPAPQIAHRPLDAVLGGDDIPDFDAPPPPPIDRAREYADKFKLRLTECPTVETYNDIMGSETVGKNLAGLKANRPELHAEIEVVREETLKRLTGAAPIPERGPELVDDEVPF